MICWTTDAILERPNGGPKMMIHLAAAGFDPNASIANFRALLLGLVSLALIVITVVGLFVAGRKGNPNRAASIVAATIICLVPLALSLGVGAAAFGAAFLGWAVPGISK